VAVHVTATDPRIQVLDFSPRRISVTIDRVTTRTVPIKPVLRSVPNGFELGDPELSQPTAQVSGPQSVVNRVQDVEATVQIDPSGIDINRLVPLVPVDGAANPLTSVDVTPGSVQVKIAVFTDRRTKSVPVNPVVTGTPAAGFEVASVTVDPLVLAIQGDANDLSAIDRADTQPISVSGASSDVIVAVSLNLPNGVEALGPGTVGVTVRLRPITSTRTFEAGLVLVGASPDREYTLSVDQVLVTIGGSVADLDRLSGATLALTVDVNGLGDGAHKIVPDANLTTGLSLISVAPSPIGVTITTPASSPASSASP
jgi:YbbR domain-containing protein